jgi:hypothetical protein
MAKDKRIGEVPGISAAAVVALNRAGIVSLHDLLAAEFDRVAHVVDDYNEAARLVKEARRIADGGRRSKHADPLVPGPLSQNQAPSASRHHSRSAAHAADAAPAAPAQEGEGILAGAMGLCMRGVRLEGEEAGERRSALAKRFEVGLILAGHGASEAELAAAMLVELGESGGVSAEEVESRCGAGVVALMEECGALRAVPVLPSGKAPKYYLEMAAGASREARRVCAALLVVAAGSMSGAGGQWHGRLLLEALESGGPEELVSIARTAVDGGKRAAA